MNSKFIIIMVLFASNVVDGTQSRDFCEAFADNGFQISFGYSAGTEKTFLVIRGNYWFVEENPKYTLSLKSSDSKVNDVFENRYRFAIYNKMCSGGRCQWMTGLGDTKRSKIQWEVIDYRLDNGSYTLTKSDDNRRYVINSTQILFRWLDPSMAFRYNNESAILVTQRKSGTNPTKFIRTFNDYEFADQTGIAINRTDIRGWAHFNITDSREAIAMTEGYVFFKVNESVIIYCDYDPNDYECKRNAKVLVNCSHLLQTSNGTQTKDFCEAFAENGFQISYGLEYYAQQKTFVFIDHHYWQLYWTTITGLYLYSNESKVMINWFGREYRNAFVIEFCKQSLCDWFIGLYDDKSHSIKWAPLLLYTETNGSSVIRKPFDSNRYFLNSSDIKFETHFNPSMAFGFQKEITFIDQKIVNTTEMHFMRTFRWFQIESNSVFTNKTDDMIYSWKNLMNKHNISFENDESVFIQSDTKEAIAYFNNFVLFKETDSITYCMTEFGINRLCKKEPKLLINCSHMATTPSAPELPSTKSSTESSSLSPSPESDTTTSEVLPLETSDTIEEESTEWMFESHPSMETQTEELSESPELDYQTSHSPFDWFTREDIMSTIRRRDPPFGPESFWIIMCIIVITLTLIAIIYVLCIFVYLPYRERLADPSNPKSNPKSNPN